MIVYHCFGCLNDGSILPLCNPILLRVIRNGVLPLDPCLNTKIIEIPGGVFSSIIWSQHLDPPFDQVLNPSFKFLKSRKDSILGLQEVNPRLPRVIIDEEHIVQIFVQGSNSHGSTHIWMYQVQDPLGSVVTVQKNPLTFLPRAQPLQTPSCWTCISGRHVTIFPRAGRDL